MKENSSTLLSTEPVNDGLTLSKFLRPSKMPYFATISAFSMYDCPFVRPGKQRRSARYFEVIFSVEPYTFNRVTMFDEDTFSRYKSYKPRPFPYLNTNGNVCPTRSCRLIVYTPLACSISNSTLKFDSLQRFCSTDKQLSDSPKVKVLSPMVSGQAPNFHLPGNTRLALAIRTAIKRFKLPVNVSPCTSCNSFVVVSIVKSYVTLNRSYCMPSNCKVYWNWRIPVFLTDGKRFNL